MLSNCGVPDSRGVPGSHAIYKRFAGKVNTDQQKKRQHGPHETQQSRSNFPDKSMRGLFPIAVLLVDLPP